MRAHEIHEPCEAAAPVGGERPRHELGLVSVAVRRHHQALRHLVGDLRAEVAPHQVQQHVEPGRRAGRGQHAPLIHIERIGLHTDARIACCELRHVSPVGGGAPAVEHPGRGQHEDPGADRAQPGAPRESPPQLRQKRRGRRLCGVAPAGNDDRIGRIEQPQRVAHPDLYAAGGAQRPALRGAHRELVPRHAELRPRQREQLHGAAELEGTQPVVGQRDHFVAHWRDLNVPCRLRHWLRSALRPQNARRRSSRAALIPRVPCRA